ncbi:hypothetical protein QR680_005261 [Steinernema hermaphroditum]|uniref:ATP-dependent RNA helicase n=1 Tax=Steinernema hermaphroditum TaxID=289476 RepID=A0AA39HTP0_9BILA|nr:hypothetical protein QR680_005261 [Steinernema hermaphroditum]
MDNWEKRNFSDESDSDSENSLSDDEDESSPLARAAPRSKDVPPVNENMTGLLEEEDEHIVPQRFQPSLASDYPLPSYVGPSTAPSPPPAADGTSSFSFQQKRSERPVDPPNERLLARPGELFSHLTNVDRIKFELGDGESGFIDSFDKYEFHKQLIKNLTDLGVTEPTAVQKATWYIMLKKYRYSLAAQAQTGSGKTFAFLVPLIQRVFEIKEMMKANKSTKPKNAPIGVIFVPTCELVNQITENAEHLAKNMDVSVTSSKGKRHVFREGTDLHVTTMGGMMYALSTDEKRKHPLIQLSNVYLTVFDEVDKFFNDHDTRTQSLSVLERVQENPNARIFAFSATFGGDVVEFMERDGYFRIMDSEIIPPSIDHKTFILQPHQAQTAIISLLRHLKKQNNGELPQILIFANRRVTCDVLCFHLATYGFPAVSLTSKWGRVTRNKVANSFARGQKKILVCSDVLAPGIDWVVDVVINYHLPPNHQFDRFNHRIGRTGRAGNRGTVYSFFYDAYNIRDQINADDFAQYLMDHGFSVPKKLQEFHEYYRRKEQERTEGAEEEWSMKFEFDEPDLSRFD